MKRCQKCLLPENYPDIPFNEKGECNFCINHKAQSHKGELAFSKEIEGFLNIKSDRSQKYDCILSFNGGRDSSYLLHWLKNN